MAGLVRRSDDQHNSVVSANDAPGGAVQPGDTPNKRINYDTKAQQWEDLPEHIRKGLHSLGLCHGTPVIQVIDAPVTRRKDGQYRQVQDALWGQPEHLVKIVMTRPLQELKDKKFKPSGDWSAEVDAYTLGPAEHTSHQWGGSPPPTAGSSPGSAAATPPPPPMDAKQPAEMLHPGLVHQLGPTQKHWARRITWEHKATEQILSLTHGDDAVRMICSERHGEHPDHLHHQAWVAENWAAPIISTQHHSIAPPSKGHFGRLQSAPIVSSEPVASGHELPSGSAPNNRSLNR